VTRADKRRFLHAIRPGLKHIARESGYRFETPQFSEALWEQLARDPSHISLDIVNEYTEQLTKRGRRRA
jgi:hypothetical protein